ncbi:DeoR family transcriptional regulator [Pseudonocardia adelaidensis]|uniref:HTH deoR-type domain-containing protein n=1 Tax=Pseudonocardia adelaidensis TaxID=648754 RepID=A0ABP9NJY3_9PSEU
MSKPSARQERILAILRSRGPARVAELAREFDVSPITLRRDAEVIGSLLALVPLVVAFLMLQRYWRSGPTAGSVE